MKQISKSKNNPIQYQITEYISKNTKKAIRGFSELSTEGRCYRVFYNFRIINNTPQGLKLTTWGKNQLGKHFNSYEFDNEALLNGKVLMKLDSAMEWPYYVSRNKIVLFNETDAAWFRLNGQNLADYINIL